MMQTNTNKSSQRLKYLIVVASAGVLLTYFYGRIDYRNHRYDTWDLHDYRTMAQTVPSFTQEVRQPFVFRLLGPYLAGLMPFSTDTNFIILSMFLGLVLPLLFYLYLSNSLVTPPIAALVSIFFILNKYLYGFPIWNYFQICDILSQIEIVLLMWAMTSQKWTWFGILLIIGSLTKEITLMMIPVAIVFAYELKLFSKLWLRLLFAVLPGLLIAVLLRFMLSSDQGNNLVQAFYAYQDKLSTLDTWFRLAINSFIPFSLVPFIFFKRTHSYFQTRKHELFFFALVILSTFFGYNNERLMGPAFIVFYPLLAIVIQSDVIKSKWITFIMIIAAILSNFHHSYARFPLPRELTIVFSLFALAMVTVSLIIYKIWLTKIYKGQINKLQMPA